MRSAYIKGILVGPNVDVDQHLAATEDDVLGCGQMGSILMGPLQK